MDEDDIEMTVEEARLPQFLVEQAPGFGRSKEYMRLDADDRLSISVVCSTFSAYVESLYVMASRGSTSPVEAEIADAVNAIEQMASSSDIEVRNWLVVDVFETLDLPESMRSVFLAHLGPRARALYDEWL